jgi:hypothetical protein
MNYVSDFIVQYIVLMENIIDVWNDLVESFSQGDLVREFRNYRKKSMNLSKILNHYKKIGPLRL